MSQRRPQLNVSRPSPAWSSMVFPVFVSSTLSNQRSCFHDSDLPQSANYPSKMFPLIRPFFITGMCVHLCPCALYSVVCGHSLPRGLVRGHTSCLNTLHIRRALIPTQNFKLPEGVAMLVLFFAKPSVPGTAYVLNKCVREEPERKLRPLVLGWLLNCILIRLPRDPPTLPCSSL